MSRLACTGHKFPISGRDRSYVDHEGWLWALIGQAGVSRAPSDAWGFRRLGSRNGRANTDIDRTAFSY